LTNAKTKCFAVSDLNMTSQRECLTISRDMSYVLRQATTSSKVHCRSKTTTEPSAGGLQACHVQIGHSEALGFCICQLLRSSLVATRLQRKLIANSSCTRRTKAVAQFWQSSLCGSQVAAWAFLWFIMYAECAMRHTPFYQSHNTSRIGNHNLGRVKLHEAAIKICWLSWHWYICTFDLASPA